MDFLHDLVRSPELKPAVNTLNKAWPSLAPRPLRGARNGRSRAKRFGHSSAVNLHLETLHFQTLSIKVLIQNSNFMEDDCKKFTVYESNDPKQMSTKQRYCQNSVGLCLQSV
jgi:hypothetical protein